MPSLAALRSVLFASATWQVVALRDTASSFENALEVEGSDSEVGMRWNIFDKTGPKLLNISQGSLGDCYFLAGLAAVANTHPDLIEKVFVGSGNLNARGRSVYRLRFMMDGKEQFVAIDDMIPMKPKGYNPRFYFASFHNGDNAWPALIEKGFAKLAGSYLAISGGFEYEAFQAITQSPVDHLFQSNEKAWDETQIWEFIKTAIDNTWPVGAGTGDRVHNIGTANGHAYAIMSVGTKKGKKAIQVYNPWGTANRYRGELKDLASRDQGDYWMTLTEFTSAFTTIVRARVWKDAHSSSLSIPAGAARSLTFTTSSDKPFYVQLQWPTTRTLPRGCDYEYKETNIALRVAPDKKPEKGVNSDYLEAYRSSSMRVYMPGGAGKYNIMAMAWFEKMTGVKDVSVFVYSQDPISDFHWEKEVSAVEAVNKVYGTCDTIKWNQKQWTATTETFRGSPLWTTKADESIFFLENQMGFRASPSKEKYDYYYDSFKIEDVKCGWGGYLAFLNRLSLAEEQELPESALVETASTEACDQKAVEEKLSRHYNLDNFYEMVTLNKEDSKFPPEMRSIGEPGVDCGDKATGKKADCERLNSWGSITVEYGYANYVPNYNIFPMMPLMPGLPGNLLPGKKK